MTSMVVTCFVVVAMTSYSAWLVGINCLVIWRSRARRHPTRW
jgi:hypothetical protein